MPYFNFIYGFTGFLQLWPVLELLGCARSHSRRCKKVWEAQDSEVAYSPSSWDVSQNKTKSPQVPAAALTLPYFNCFNPQQLNEEFGDTEAQSVRSQLVRGRRRERSQRGAQEPTFLTTVSDSSRLGLGSFPQRTRGNILGFLGHSFSVTALQLCHCSGKAGVAVCK